MPTQQPSTAVSKVPPADLEALLDRMDANAALVERHLWLVDLLQWIRGDGRSAMATAGRVDLLLDTLDARPHYSSKLRDWWRVLMQTVDDSALLADYGFASRNAFLSELVERIHRKLLPATPETTDAGELFSLAFTGTLDSQWIAALSPATLQRLATLLSIRASDQAIDAPASQTHWQASVLEAIIFCNSHIRAAGYSPEIRLRMNTSARASNPFHTLSRDFDRVRDAWWATCQPQADELAPQQLKWAVEHYIDKLEACRQAVASVYTHLDSQGISVNLVFRLRQLRERVLRIRALLDCLLGEASVLQTAKLVAHLVAVGQDQRSLGALMSSNSSLLAAKVAERSSETGEHYITRTRAEYRAMLRHAAGGGAITAATTALKFAVLALGLSAFWSGMWSGLVYAASFVVIQLLQFTLATKQPAMTAPAMAAKLKDIGHPDAVRLFVDEVSHLVRSQFAAVLGNVGMVFPVVAVLSWAMQFVLGSPMISPATAQYVLESLHLLGPSLLFAALTGVLLFACSMIAGWVENWFVLHRLDSAIRYNPAISSTLGAQRAARWAQFMRQNVSGLAANISLGLMLGLVPAVLGFFGLGLDVRHVTLSAGQLGAACASLGWDVVRNPNLWWAVASIPLIGVLNVGVSFFLAFRVALTAHNVSGLDRTQIRQAIWARLCSAPLSFVWPAPEDMSKAPSRKD
jgi:site-specific recombinase